MDRLRNPLLSLARMAESLQRARTREELALVVCEGAVETAALALAWVALKSKDDSGRDVLVPVAVHGPAAGFAAGFLQALGSAPENGNPAAWALAGDADTAQPLISTDLQHDSRFQTWRAAASEHGLRGYAVYPLVCAGELVGALHLCSVEVFGSDELALFTSLASNAALGLARLVREHMLRQSEESFRDLLESVGDVVWTAAYDGAGRAYVSGAAERIYGRTADEFLGDPALWSKVIHPEDQERAARGSAEMLAHGQTEIQYRVLRPDGQVRWVLERARILRDSAGQRMGLGGVVTDITERVLGEQARIEYASNMERTQALAQVGHWGMDLRTGRIVSSAQTRQIYSQEPDQELTGEIIAAAIHPDDQELINTSWQATVKGAPFDIEHRLRIRGEVRWVRSRAELVTDADGRPMAIHGMLQDITVRKRAVEALEKSNRMLAALSRAQARFIVQTDPQITFEEMLRLLLELTDSEYGFIGEVLHTGDGKPYLRTYAITSLPRTEQARAFFTRNDPRGKSLEFHNSKTLFGVVMTTGQVVISNDPANDPRRGGVPADHTSLDSFLGLPFVHGGKLVGMAGIANRPGGYDEELARSLEPFLTTCASLVTAYRHHQHRVMAEEALRKLNAELEHRVASRTAELERANRELESFTYSVSHDLKAPLRGIDGYCTLLLEEHAHMLDDEGRGFLDKVRRSANNMSQLIEDLLAYSRLERRVLATAAVNPRAMVEALLTEHSGELRARGVIVEVDIPVTSVAADREGLAMALRNLIENAIKFTRDAQPPRIEIGGQENDAACLLWVRDNGCGFDMRYHDRIFEIFQRLHRAEIFPGTGVGLALVRKALQRMGGRAWAESRPGAGATFYLEIPR